MGLEKLIRFQRSPTPNAIDAMLEKQPSLECSRLIVYNSYVLNNPIQAFHKGLVCWVLLQVILPICLIREMAHEAMRKRALQQPTY